MPIIDTYKKMHKVHVVDSSPPPDVVFASVCELFDVLDTPEDGSSL